LLALGLLLLLFGCVGPTGPETQRRDTVSIGTFSRAIDYAPYIVAKNQGWFEEVSSKYGKTVEYTEFQSLPAINEALATKNLDVVFEAEPPAIIGYAAGVDVRIKGVGVSLVQEVVVPKESGIRSVSDLHGKKVAVLSGSSSHYGVVKMIEQSGLSLADVELLDMNPPNAKAAFESGQIDAWAVWPPWIEQEVVEGRGVTLSGGDVFIQSIVAMRGAFVQENPGLARDLLGVVRRAQSWIADNPEQAQSIIAGELGLPLEVVREAWPKHDFQPALGQRELDDIQAKADFLFDAGLIKNRVQVADLIDVDLQ